MILRNVFNNERTAFDRCAGHPMQSWAWGDFKSETDVSLERIGYYENNTLKRTIQVFFHKIPSTGFTIGYFPKGYMPDEEQLAALIQMGKRHNAIAIKMEPNVAQPVETISGHDLIEKFLLEHQCKPGRSLFTKYTFILDLSQDEDRLLQNCKSKTRYNINLAKKKGVEIVENTSEAGMLQYIEILKETTQRQGFYAHTPEYFTKMWKVMGDTGMLRIFEARYEGVVLTSWILFVYGDTLYYPYGSSRTIHRDVMASNLMMWEVIRFGKKMGLKKLDMWGALGPDPDPKHPWHGFHRFKEGYGGTLYEFLGTYDLVINFPMYSIYRVLEDWRWKILKTKTRLLKLIGR